MAKPRLLDPEPMPGWEIVFGPLHPGTPDDWTLHPARMQDVDGVPHIVLPHWSKPAETPEFRWGDTKQCPACDSSDVDRQTAEEGRPFSCNNCGLEFFKDTPKA